MTRARETLGIWLALAPALAVVGLLVGASLAYGLAQSLGALPVVGESRLSLDAYGGLLSGSAPATREFWPALGLIDAPAEFPVLVRDHYGLGIILHYVSKEIPFLALIVLAVLRTQGATYDLVAENLGASPWQRLRLVTLPLVLPALAAGSALVFAFVLGAYEVPALLGVRHPRTLAVLALEFFVNPDLNRRAEGMAVSLLISLVALAVVGLANVQRNAWNAER